MLLKARASRLACNGGILRVGFFGIVFKMWVEEWVGGCSVCEVWVEGWI